MIKIFHKTLKDKRLISSKKFITGSWIYVEKPTIRELTFLSKKYGVDKSLLKDALDKNEVPRLEFKNKTVYVFSRAPYQKEGVVSTLPFLIILHSNFLMTVSDFKLPVLKRFLKGKVNFYTTQKIKFFIQIFFELTSYYSRFLVSINKSVHTLEVRLKKIKNEDIIRFVNFEKILNDFLAALIPTRGILENLLSGKYLMLFKKDQELIDDLFLANGQLIEECKSLLKSIVNIRDAYSTLMGNNLNRIVKFLTALTIILSIPTIIASIYGMNLKLPLASSPNAFWFIMGITLGISFALTVIFIKEDWL